MAGPRATNVSGFTTMPSPPRPVSASRHARRNAVGVGDVNFLRAGEHQQRLLGLIGRHEPRQWTASLGA